MTFFERTVRSAHRAYKLTLSPLIGRQCRFYPTCSDYSAKALIAHGARRGGLLAVRRMCRCHPWGASGYDPVPPPADERPILRPSRRGALKCEP
ncbi:MAG: membrane protein insertion efficiency factor YidD [Caulobacteraceae bacterium]|nr:membrane protein insertion efficiency factor YidD [Caulobacteraceae bacterium]